MKAQAFLELVGRMISAQQDYFAARRKSIGVIATQDLLVKAKELEKQVIEVVKEGKLEPDESSNWLAELDAIIEKPAQLALDLSGNPLPTDEQGDQQ